MVEVWSSSQTWDFYGTSGDNDFKLVYFYYAFWLFFGDAFFFEIFDQSFAFLYVSQQFRELKDIFSVCNRLAVDWLIQHLQPTGRI